MLRNLLKLFDELGADALLNEVLSLNAQEWSLVCRTCPRIAAPQ